MDNVLVDVDKPSELNHDVLHLFSTPPNELIDIKVYGVVNSIRKEIGKVRQLTYQKVKEIHHKYNIDINHDEFYELEKEVIEKNIHDNTTNKMAIYLNKQQFALFSAIDGICLLNLYTVILLYVESLRNAHMQNWELCFHDLCTANLRFGAIGAVDSKLSKKLKATDLANQRHRNENKKTQIIIERVIALWEAGNTAAGRGWKNYTECTDSIFQRPDINKSYRTVYGWISKHEQSKRTQQS